MKKLKELTPEQIVKMEEIKNVWLKRLFSCENRIDEKEATEGIEWLYETSGLKKPQIYFVESPMACQKVIAHLKTIDTFEQFDMKQALKTKVTKVEPFSQYGNIWDYGWVAFYHFFQEIGIVEHEGFRKFKALLEANIYDMIQMDKVCVVSQLPSKIVRDNQNRLHNDEGSAIEFRDGYKLFFWHAVAIPERWIMDRESIDKDEIMKETNAEKRRVMREILGAEKYYKVAYGKDGLVVIDEDTDHQGNPMRLMETRDIDEICNAKVQFLECMCPSTERVYNIYPPNQKSKNVWEAKASTFNKKQSEFNPTIES